MTLSEREKYERLHREHPVFGRVNHGQGSEPLTDGFASLLDVGGAYSAFAGDVLARGHVKRAVVTDLSEACRAEQEARGVEYVCCPALTMRLGKFDVVTCFDVIEHFPVDERAVSIANIYAHATHRLIFSIGFGPSWGTLDGQKHVLHHTIEPQEWWEDYMRGFGGELRIDVRESFVNKKGGLLRMTPFFVVDL